MRRHCLFTSTLMVALLALVIFAFVGLMTDAPPRSQSAEPVGPPVTYADYGRQAITNMIADFYTQGRWKYCISGCIATNTDWGADSLTYTLYLRWLINNEDTSVIPYLQTLGGTAPSYPPPCQTTTNCFQWSDQPLWDSVALGREYEATGQQNASILAKEKASFDVVDQADPSIYAFGACPGIHYQQPGSGYKLKTLETDSNYIKAALLLYSNTQDASYLAKARAQYAAVRRHFLDPHLPLYSVYVFDDGTTCSQVQGRFFASVNGNMIFNGLTLAQDTSDPTYRVDALATAQAVADHLSDANGVFADMQAENDIVEPLIEAMYNVATTQHQPFAASWLLAAASASASSLKANGAYSRFFDGPPNPGTSTEWQSNGGYALAVAAAALDPNGTPETNTAWASATTHLSLITTLSLPASITFTGSGIALIGTLGEQCCEPGHARVFIDGSETTDTTGIWQNKSSSGISIPQTVLFAWRWPTSGTHTIKIRPGVLNAKEGPSFIDIRSYLVLDEPPGSLCHLQAQAGAAASACSAADPGGKGSGVRQIEQTLNQPCDMIRGNATPAHPFPSKDGSDAAPAPVLSHQRLEPGEKSGFNPG